MSEEDRLVNSGEQIRRFERDFQITRDEVIALKQTLVAAQSDNNDNKQSLRELAARFDESKKTNWPFIMALIAAVPFIYVMMNSLTSNAIAPLTSEYSALKSDQGALTGQVHDITSAQVAEDRQISNIAQQTTENATGLKSLETEQSVLVQRSASSLEADSNSRTDRAQLNDRVAKVENSLAQEIGDRRSEDATLRTQLAEVETQFHAVSDDTNLRAAEQERLNSLLWDKAYGQKYPSGVFFPPSMFQPDGIDATARH